MKRHEINNRSLSLCQGDKASMLGGLTFQGRLCMLALLQPQISGSGSHAGGVNSHCRAIRC